MAVSSTVIAAYRRCYNPVQLKEALVIALADRATGVLVTQVNFQDGGGAGTPITGDPNELIEILELCLQQVEGASSGRPPLASLSNFSFRRSET